MRVRPRGTPELLLPARRRLLQHHRWGGHDGSAVMRVQAAWQARAAATRLPVPPPASWWTRWQHWRVRAAAWCAHAAVARSALARSHLLQYHWLLGSTAMVALLASGRSTAVTPTRALPRTRQDTIRPALF